MLSHSFPSGIRTPQFKGNIQSGTNAIPDAFSYSRPITQTHTSNGIQIVSESWDTPIISIGVGIKAGSSHETRETSGVAHFLEHITLRGTEKRTRSQLEQSVENIGAHLNASTTREYTLFHMLTTQQNLQFAIEVLGDCLLNVKVDDAAIDQERSTILSEQQEVGTNEFEVLMENVVFGVLF